MKPLKHIIAKFKCMNQDCKLSWKVKKKLKHNNKVLTDPCCNCGSKYFTWTNYTELFGNMNIEQLEVFSEEHN